MRTSGFGTRGGGGGGEGGEDAAVVFKRKLVTGESFDFNDVAKRIKENDAGEKMKLKNGILEK